MENVNMQEIHKNQQREKHTRVRVFVLHVFTAT